jgi:asparagine N-glycosylation enzyme membrane subunit Stt3
LTYGAKLSTVFFSSVMLVCFFELLKKSKIPFPWVWVVILAIASHVFLYRLSLPRAPVIALSFLFLGQHFILGKNYKTLAALSVLFVWLYGGFTIFILFAALMILSRLLIEKQMDYKSAFSVSGGVIAGLLTHPYFPENIILVYTQTFSAGVNRVVVGGGEWYPYGLGEWIGAHMGISFVFLSILTAFVCAKAKPRFDTLGWLAFLVVTFALTLNSRRFIEYLIPAMAMTSAVLFRDAWEIFGEKEIFARKWTLPTITGVVFFVLILFGGHQFSAATNKLADPRTPDRYKKAALWIKAHGPGTTVFNTDWDDFPELFFYNAQNGYVAGLDPAFLYLYNKEMYRKWIEISNGKIKEDPYPILKDEFKAQFLFTDTDHVPFIELMERNPRIGLVYMDDNARVYALK